MSETKPTEAAGRVAKAPVLPAVKLATRLVTASTPEAGKGIRNAGLKLLGGAALTGGISEAVPEIGIDVWTERLRLFLLILTAVQGIAGTVLTAIGQGQTTEPPAPSQPS